MSVLYSRGPMRNSRLTEEQIIAVLHELEAGAKVAELCRRQGVTETTIHRRRQKYGGLQVSEPRRLKSLEDENRQLKRIVADQALHLQGSAGEKAPTREQRRAAVTSAIETAKLSERRACRFTGFSRSTQRYRSHRASDAMLTIARGMSHDRRRLLAVW